MDQEIREPFWGICVNKACRSAVKLRFKQESVKIEKVERFSPPFPCPKCGAAVLMLDGIYKFVAENEVVFIDGPEYSKKTLKTIRTLSSLVQLGFSNADEFIKEACKVSPEIKKALENPELQNKIKGVFKNMTAFEKGTLLLTLIGLILTALNQFSPKDDGPTVNITVNNFYNNNAETRQETKKENQDNSVGPKKKKRGKP